MLLPSRILELKTGIYNSSMVVLASHILSSRCENWPGCVPFFHSPFPQQTLFSALRLYSPCPQRGWRQACLRVVQFRRMKGARVSGYEGIMASWRSKCLRRKERLKPVGKDLKWTLGTDCWGADWGRGTSCPLWLGRKCVWLSGSPPPSSPGPRGGLGCLADFGVSLVKI